MTLSVSGDSITFPDLSTQLTAPSGFGFKNRLINGSMMTDQRNAFAAKTIVAAAALAYTADRWYGYCTGANVTGQVVAGSLKNRKRYQFTGAASVTAIRFGQRIEAINSFDLNNGNINVSVDLANSLLTTVTWTLNRATTTDDTFGSIASPTVTQVATGTFTVTPTLTRYDTAIAIPAAATTGLELVFSVGAQTSGTWTIGDVQLAAGSVATAFDVRSVGQELTLCQRYYEKSYAPTVTPGSAVSPNTQHVFSALPAINNTFTYGVILFSVLKRAAPTVVIFNAAGVTGRSNNDSGTSYGASTAVPGAAHEARFHVNNGSGATLSVSFGTASIHWTATAALSILYKLNKNSTSVTCLSDNASIPADEANTDYAAYLQWLSEGNVPEPADISPAPSYQELRAAAYPPFSDYLDGIVKGSAEQVQEYVDACLAVKERFPKPANGDIA